jgi:hypothetical protein
MRFSADRIDGANVVTGIEAIRRAHDPSTRAQADGNMLDAPKPRGHGGRADTYRPPECTTASSAPHAAPAHQGAIE